MIEKIQKYWDERAERSAGERSATTDDVHLRDLEVSTIAAALGPRLPKPATILDLGCGDGDTTLRIAAALPGVRVHGIDYASNMIASAHRRLDSAATLRERVSFDVGDATKLISVSSAIRYDAIITCRVLINLPAAEMQFDVIRQIARALKPGGAYVGTENFTDGQRNLNTARATMGLTEIPVRWHNLFFERDQLLVVLRNEFADVEIHDFASSYYFATRVVYSAMCLARGETPDYDHEIHRLAPRLPPTGRFSPVQLIAATNPGARR